MNRQQKRQSRHLKVVDTNEQNKKRIFWVSNAPWAATGYGQQTAQATTRLQKDYEVAIGSNYGLEANSTYWASENGPIYIYPRGHDQWSNDIMPAHAQDWFSKNKDVDNLIVTLFDTWVFKGPKWSEFKVASWVPVDHTPVPPAVALWNRKPNVIPLAMSKYGQQMLENQGIGSFYIPHGIENTFEPTETISIGNEKITGRKFIGVPEDAFLVGMNAANKGVYPNRKAFGENFLAFSQFAQDKTNAFLYVHTDPAASMGGIDLTHLAQAVGLKEEQVIFADRYNLRSGFSQKLLAALYTSFDVLLATSMGEGFGIPTVEAQACGTRVIVSDFAASSELCGDGWKIGGQPVWDAPQLSWFHVPYVDQIISALKEAYNADRAPSIKAMEHAEQYRADVVYQKHWKPALEAIWEGNTPDPVQFGTN